MKPESLQLAFQNSMFVRGFFFYPTIGSTNDRAKELAAQGVKEGTIVVADSQSAGRGRSDRAWFSPPGLGVYVSMVFRPEIAASGAFGVLAAVSVGAANAVEELEPGPAVGIKWPNDLMIESKKLAGVLSEIGTAGGALDWCVVGIGLNINHREDDFPEPLRGRATSLRIECDREIDRVAFLADLVERTGYWYRDFLESGPERVMGEWRRRSTVLGKAVRLETAGETYVGVAQAIEPDGALRIRLESGAEEVLRAGDVQLVQFR